MSTEKEESFQKAVQALVLAAETIDHNMGKIQTAGWSSLRIAIAGVKAAQVEKEMT